METVKDVSFNTAKEIQRSFSLIGTAALGMVSVAAGAMAEGIAKTVEWEVHILHLAQASGTSVEQLSGLAAAADMMGLSVDDVATAMERFDKNLLTMQSGTGVNSAFKQVFAGIDPAKIKQSDDALKLIADRFAKLADGATKSGEAQTLWGRTGAAMIPIMNLGSKGVQDLIDEAKAMGRVITKDQAEAAEIFEQNIKRMQASLHGLMIEITNATLPALNALLAEFQNTSRTQGFMHAVGQLAGAVAGGVGSVVTPGQSGFGGIGALAGYAAAGDQIVASQEKMRTSVEGLTADFVAHSKEVDKVKKSVESVIATYQTSIATMGMTNLQVTEYKLRADAAKAGVSGWVEQELRQIDVLAKRKSWLEQLAVLDNSKIDEEKRNFLEDKVRLDQQDLELLQKKADLVMQPGTSDFSTGMALGSARSAPQANGAFMDAYNQLTSDLEHQIAVWGMTTDQVTAYNLALQDSSAAAQAMVPKVIALQDQLKQMQDVTAAWKEFENIGLRTFDELIFSGKSLGDVLKNLAKQLGELALRWIMLGPPGGGGNGGGAGAGGGGLFGAIFNGLKGIFAGFAGGGGVTSGQPILVGENGPEIFTPSVTGAIIPNASIGGSGRGATINYNIDARGSSITEEQFRRSLQQSENRAVQRSLNATRELNLRTA